MKKIKRIDDRITAILESPMIEVRRRPLGQSRSFTSGEGRSLKYALILVDKEVRTPIRVPSSTDLDAVTSRRLSAALLSKFATHTQSLPALKSNRNSDWTGTLSSRRNLTGGDNTPIRKSFTAR